MSGQSFTSYGNLLADGDWVLRESTLLPTMQNSSQDFLYPSREYQVSKRIRVTLFTGLLELWLLFLPDLGEYYLCCIISCFVLFRTGLIKIWEVLDFEGWPKDKHIFVPADGKWRCYLALVWTTRRVQFLSTDQPSTSCKQQRRQATLRRSPG